MRYFSPKEAVKYLKDDHGLKISEATLRAYRCRGVGGPRFSIPVRGVEYSQADLDAWVAERRGKTFTSAVEATTYRHARTVGEF